MINFMTRFLSQRSIYSKLCKNMKPLFCPSLNVLVRLIGSDNDNDDDGNGSFDIYNDNDKDSSDNDNYNDDNAGYLES